MIGLLPLTGRFFLQFTAILLLSLPIPSLWACDHQLNLAAFSVPFLNENRLLPNGMISIQYGSHGEESMIHMTVHRIVMTLPGKQTMLPEHHDPRYIVLYTDGTLSPMTYVIIKNALFYGTGSDLEMYPEKSWIDPNEDGLNGNENPTQR